MRRLFAELLVKPIFIAAFGLLPVVAAHAGPGPSSEYAVGDVAVTDLGTLGGRRSSANDINSRGIIVGWADDADGVAQSFYYADGAMYLLDPSVGPTINEATGINDNNQVAGTLDVGTEAHAFRAELGASLVLLHDESDFDHWLVSSAATAISDSGLVVGHRRDAPRREGWSRRSEATLWPDLTSHVELESIWLEGVGIANDVNSAGLAVGHIRDRYKDHITEVIRWDTTSKERWYDEEIPLPAAAVPPDCYYYTAKADALGINRPGAVVGYAVSAVPEIACDAYVKLAFYWDGYNNYSTLIGVLPTGTHSVAEDINDDDFIVGYADQVTGEFSLGLDEAFLYHRDFGLFALPRPKSAAWFGHCRAKALNNRVWTTGRLQVVGTCDTVSGKTAVRWDVTIEPRPAIPPFPKK